MNNVITCINGHKVCLTTHATERIIERFKALSIVFPDNEGYIDLALGGIEQVLKNPFMDKYLYNLVSKSKYRNEHVLVYDEVNKMIYALVVKPHEKGRIVVKTIGTEHNNTEWIYRNKSQRLCWIYKDVFKFSTVNGNVTWY